MKDAWLLPGCHKYVGLPPWVKLGEGNLFLDELDEDDAVAEYWADYVFGEGLRSPGEHRSVFVGRHISCGCGEKEPGFL